MCKKYILAIVVANYGPLPRCSQKLKQKVSAKVEDVWIDLSLSFKRGTKKKKTKKTKKTKKKKKEERGGVLIPSLPPDHLPLAALLVVW